MNLFTDFLNQCEKQRYWSKSSRVLVAVSGGVDSMVLLDMMQRLPSDLKPWFGVVHVNHQLRESSVEEAAFLEHFCRTAGIPFYMTKWDKGQQPKANEEEAARNFRYAFFRDVFVEQQATHLLTGHHGDDQVETILMRLVRGGTLESMAGIKEVRPFLTGALVRPLLPYTKEELYYYSKEHQLQYFEDETNLGLAYTRNRYRNQVIPLLKRETSQLAPHFANFSSDLQDALAVAQVQIGRQLNHICKKQANGNWELDCSLYLLMESSLQRLILQHLLMEIYANGEQQFQRQHIQILHNLISNEKPNGQIDLPGKWIAKRSYDTLTFSPVVDETVRDESSIQLQLNEWVHLPQGGKLGLFRAETNPTVNDRKAVWLGATSVQLPITIRQRQPGDRMSLKGTTGTKKIKDVLIDQKVPLYQRDEVRVVCDAKGDVICFLGYRDSRLSIERETDTIQYILIHDQNGDET